ARTTRSWRRRWRPGRCQSAARGCGSEDRERSDRTAPARRAGEGNSVPRGRVGLVAGNSQSRVLPWRRQPTAANLEASGRARTANTSFLRRIKGQGGASRAERVGDDVAILRLRSVDEVRLAQSLPHAVLELRLIEALRRLGPDGDVVLAVEP